MPRLDDERTGAPLPATPGAPPDPAALPSGCAFAPRCAFAEDACREAVPELLPIGGEDRQAACFVAQRGDVVAAPPPAPVTVAEAAPPDADAVPVLEVRELRVDVGSRRRGL